MLLGSPPTSLSPRLSRCNWWHYLLPGRITGNFFYLKTQWNCSQTHSWVLAWIHIRLQIAVLQVFGRTSNPGGYSFKYLLCNVLSFQEFYLRWSQTGSPSRFQLFRVQSVYFPEQQMCFLCSHRSACGWFFVSYPLKRKLLRIPFLFFSCLFYTELLETCSCILAKHLSSCAQAFYLTFLCSHNVLFI